MGYLNIQHFFTYTGGSWEGSHSSCYSSYYKCPVGSVGQFATETSVETLGGHETRETSFHNW